MSVVLGILCVCLILYLGHMKRQVNAMNEQLEKRLSQRTTQPISIDLIHQELNSLAGNVNRCLKEEENLRMEGAREERKFRELISNISHDLRTPLTAVSGYLKLLEDSDLDQRQRSQLMIAQKHAKELGELIEHFFEYAYLVTTEPEVNTERLNINKIVTECLAASVPFFEERGLTVSLKAGETYYVAADREMTVRSIQNLIRNALWHSAGEVEVNLWREENVILSFRNPVQNAGEIDTERIFERFYTSDTARSQSAGLGLSITKLLVEQMGGNVMAEIRENKIELRVELPAVL